MNWTKETPANPGLYWMRGTWIVTGHHSDVVRIESGPDGLGVFFIGNERDYYFEEMPTDAEWYGPLEPPE